MASCSLHASRSPESPKLIQPFWSCPGRPREVHTAAPQNEAGRHFDPSQVQEFVDLTVLAHALGDPCDVPDSSQPSYSWFLLLRNIFFFYNFHSPFSKVTTCVANLHRQLACDQHHAWHYGSNTDALLCLPLQVFRACRTLHCPEHRSNNVHNENVVSIKS